MGRGVRRRRRPPEVRVGLPGWLATFADMVTLLLTFFVLMVSMANFDDNQRIEAVIRSIQEAFGTEGYDESLLNISKEEASTELTRRQESVQPTVVRLRMALAKHISDDMIRIVQNDREIRVQLDERAFFKPGSAELHPTSGAIVAALAVALRDEPVNIDVEGHTDSLGDERTNWELSASRAIAVVMALRERGPIAGGRLDAVAKGSFQPGSNFGEVSAWNRRIEFVLQADQISAKSALESVMKREK